MRTGAASIDELLAHGGWAIDDAAARAAANPGRFLLPRPETLARIEPGMQIAAIFLVLDQADPVVDGIEPWGADGRPRLVVGHERLWLWVRAVGGTGDDASVIGVIADDPIATHTRLRAGAQVRVSLGRIVDVVLEPPVPMDEELDAMQQLGHPLIALEETVRPEDPTRPPTIDPSMAALAVHHGVRPERPYPAPVVRAMLGRTAVHGARPIFGGRARPNPERGDSGWTIWAGSPDLHEAVDRDGLDIVGIPEIRSRCRDAWPFLALPPGWAFSISPDDQVTVLEDPALLD